MLYKDYLCCFYLLEAHGDRDSLRNLCQYLREMVSTPANPALKHIFCCDRKQLPLLTRTLHKKSNLIGSTPQPLHDEADPST